MLLHFSAEKTPEIQDIFLYIGKEKQCYAHLLQRNRSHNLENLTQLLAE